MLKFKQPTKASRPPPSENFIPVGPSKATIIIKNITVPLAWPAGEFFDNKGEWREFNVCLSFKAAGGPLQRSVILQRINRTVSDIVFDEIFTFNDVDPDFTIEAMIAAKRVDNGRHPGSSIASVANTVSRSFGRHLGNAFKKHSQSQSAYTISAYDFPSREEIFSIAANSLIPMARCFFRLSNAGLSGKQRVYSLKLVSVETIDPNMPKANILPLFGTICCQVLCRPACLTMTLTRGVFDIFYVDEKLLLEKLTCTLRGGCIECYTRARFDENEPPALLLPVDQHTQVETTSYETTVRVTLKDPESKLTRDFMLIMPSTTMTGEWHSAITHQIQDAVLWGEFASYISNPQAKPITMPEDSMTKPTVYPTVESKSRTLTNTDQVRTGLRPRLGNSTRGNVLEVFKDKEKPFSSSPNVTIKEPTTTPKRIERVQTSKPRSKSVLPPPPKISPTPKLGPEPLATDAILKKDQLEMPVQPLPRPTRTPNTVKKQPFLNDHSKAKSFDESAKTRRQVPVSDILDTRLAPRMSNNWSFEATTLPRVKREPSLDSAISTAPSAGSNTLPRTPVMKKKTAPPNTHVIRLSIGMDSDDENQKAREVNSSKKPFASRSNNARPPPPPYEQAIRDLENRHAAATAAAVASIKKARLPRSTSSQRPRLIAFESEVTRL
uniref:Anillin domain-containing protein n=1 Tax=Panagrellus redivivus TaxID=6233 RepID=A0A7E4VV91_PANRE